MSCKRQCIEPNSHRLFFSAYMVGNHVLLCVFFYISFSCCKQSIAFVSFSSWCQQDDAKPFCPQRFSEEWYGVISLSNNPVIWRSAFSFFLFLSLLNSSNVNIWLTLSLWALRPGDFLKSYSTFLSVNNWESLSIWGVQTHSMEYLSVTQSWIIFIIIFQKPGYFIKFSISIHIRLLSEFIFLNIYYHMQIPFDQFNCNLKVLTLIRSLNCSFWS